MLHPLWNAGGQFLFQHIDVITAGAYLIVVMWFLHYFYRKSEKSFADRDNQDWGMWRRHEFSLEALRVATVVGFVYVFLDSVMRSLRMSKIEVLPDAELWWFAATLVTGVIVFGYYWKRMKHKFRALPVKFALFFSLVFGPSVFADNLSKFERSIDFARRGVASSQAEKQVRQPQQEQQAPAPPVQQPQPEQQATASPIQQPQPEQQAAGPPVPPVQPPQPEQPTTQLDSKLAYNNRGLAKNSNGDFDGAIADFSEAIRLDPKYARAYNNRCLARNNKGQSDLALADCNEAIRLDPKYTSAYVNRGIVSLYAGLLPMALADFNQWSQFDPKNAYAALWSNVVGKRGNLPSRLAAAAKQIDMTKWPAPIVRLYLGQLTADAALTAADDSAANTKRGQVCEANFFTGEFMLQSGKKDEAAHLFRLAAADCPKDFGQYSAANAELKALGMSLISAAR
jgi:lipoprotein NlpI